MMTDIKRLFIDTAPFIYLIENNEMFGKKVEKIFNDCVQNNIEIVTSVITFSEFCVQPYRMNNRQIIQTFKNLISDLDISIYDVDLDIADLASKTRADYEFLKGMDSLQIAISLACDCDMFLTNDKKLKKINEIKGIVINDW